MDEKRLWTKLPYDVYYYVQRGRTLHHKQVWEDVPVIIMMPTADEAPIAYKVTRSGPKYDPHPDHEIRTFDGRTWWPILDSNYGWRTAEDFLSALTKSKHWAAAILHPSLGRSAVSSKPTYDEVFRNIKVRGGPRTSRDEMLARAGLGASDTMICDGRVYVQAGEPLYFAFPNRGPEIMFLEVGPEPWKGFFGYFSNLPGPTGEERRHALANGQIYDLHTLQDALATFEQQGLRIVTGGYVEIIQDLPMSHNALHMCADSILHQLLREDPVAAAFRDRLPRQIDSPGVPRDLTPLELCHALLADIVQMFPADNPERFLDGASLLPDGVKEILDAHVVKIFRQARSVLMCLDINSARSFTDLDYDALGSIG